MTLQHVSGEGAGALDVADAARIFEDRLKSALLADDGRLALSRLAGSTVAGLMPRIESSGQVGGATWRLVSAPSIPGRRGIRDGKGGVGERDKRWHAGVAACWGGGSPGQADVLGAGRAEKKPCAACTAGAGGGEGRDIQERVAGGAAHPGPVAPGG